MAQSKISKDVAAQVPVTTGNSVSPPSKRWVRNMHTVQQWSKRKLERPLSITIPLYF
jgi:hypothetical protein